MSLRAKFLLSSGLVLALVVSLLIWNSLRLLDNAVSKNADRVAHEYAVTLNLSLSPYASSGRLNDIRSYLQEMLSDPRDSFVRYIAVLDPAGRPLLQVGQPPNQLPALFRTPALRQAEGLSTVQTGRVLHARSPLLLKDNAIGALHFGISTEDLDKARDEVLLQGGAIAAVGFVSGLLLVVAFTAGIGRRLRALSEQARGLVLSHFDLALPARGGDELDVFSHSLQTLTRALQRRMGELDAAEQRLRESEARFRILFDTAPVPLTVTNESGTIVAMNQALTRTFGLTVDEVLGRRSDQFAFWDSAAERERIWGLYQREGVIRGEIAKTRLADGKTGDIAIWTSSLRLDGGPAVVWALMDLTAELEAKRALKELNASLEQRVRERSAALERANADLSAALENLQRAQGELLASEKMASLGALVAGIAHELNTPIGNSLLAATTLSDHVAQFRAQVAQGTLKRSVLDASLADIDMASQLIAGSLNKAAQLIASFKQVAADQTNDQRRRFDLRNVIDDTIATFAPRLRRAQCEVQLDVAAGIELDSYPGSLCQVINNLTTNALAHAFEDRRHGRITISADNLPDGSVALHYADDGIGMTPEVLHRVFDPFFTTKMGRGGTGLGMHIVYNIVTAMLGGRVEVDTTLGRGTCITLTLPRQAPQRRGSPETLVGA
nr:PAS domain-containing sensor histidine kinase [Massilia sp. TS11]